MRTLLNACTLISAVALVGLATSLGSGGELLAQAGDVRRWST